MQPLSNSDLVWNRACFSEGDPSKPGDKALAALLAFHGPAMNGGVLHAAECLTEAAVLAAADGFAYFGFLSVATLVREARSVVAGGEDLSEFEGRFNERYWQVIPNDSALTQVFEEDFAAHPEHYEPIH